MHFFYYFLISFFIFLVFLITGMLSFKANEKTNYNFLNHFPYEIETRKTFPYLNCLFALYVATEIIFHFDIVIIEKEIHGSDFLRIVLLFTFCIQDILCFMVFNSRIKNSFKTHIVFSAFYFSFSVAVNALVCLYILGSDYFSYYYLIFFAILILIQIVFFFLIKYDNSFIVKEEEKKNRLDISYLALAEWIFIALNILTNLFVVLMRIIK